MKKSLFNKKYWENWTGTIRILEENTGSNLFDLGQSKFLWYMLPKAKEKKKHELLGLHQDKKLLCSEGNNQQN